MLVLNLSHGRTWGHWATYELIACKGAHLAKWYILLLKQKRPKSAFVVFFLQAKPLAMVSSCFRSPTGPAQSVQMV